MGRCKKRANSGKKLSEKTVTPDFLYKFKMPMRKFKGYFEKCREEDKINKMRLIRSKRK